MSSTQVINRILGWARQRGHDARYRLKPGSDAEVAITTRTRTVGISVSGDVAWLTADPREAYQSGEELDAWLDERIGR